MWCGDGSQRFVQKISIMCTKKFLNPYRLSIGIPQARRKSSARRKSMESCRKIFCPPTWARSTGRGRKKQRDCQEMIQLSWGKQILLLAPTLTFSFFYQGMSKWEYMPTSASSLWYFCFADSRVWDNNYFLSDLLTF